MMKNRYKDTLLTRSKKYDYKVWEHQLYNEFCGYEDSMIMCKIIDYKDVKNIINKLRGNK